MNQKVSGTNQQANKLKDTKSQKTLKATISPKLSSKHLGHKKVGKRDKSDKKHSQVKSKKEIQLMTNYFDKDEYKDAEGGNYEYYNNQAQDRKQKKSTLKDKDKFQYSKSKQTSFEAQSHLKTSVELKKNQVQSTYNRLKLPQSKGVITFDGKYVKAPPQQINKHYNHHINTSNSQYTELIYGDKDNEGKKKKRKRQKSRNKTNDKKIKSKSKSKIHHDPKKKLTDMRQSLDMQGIALLKKYKSKEECVDTEPSPGQLVSYSRKEVIEYDEIQYEITKQKQKLVKVNIQKNSLNQRMKCINMLSKICGQMQFKKQTFALSVKLLDGYLNDQIVGTKMKVISISALILSLKLEEAQMAATFQFQIATANTCNNTRELRSSIPVSEKNDKKSDARSTSKKKSKKQDFNKIGDKKTDSIYNKVTTLSYILLDEFGNDMISKSQLLQFESLIVFKLNYLIRFKTNAYWVDLLTVVWDQRMLSLHPENDKLLFRCPKYRINMSYLLQILQILHYDLQVYNYSEVALVLSVIYLLIRITMQEDPDGYENYRKVLQKSSNALFVDNVGCNKLFGQFLQSISMQMGQILQCCQFVSAYLLPGILKKHRLHGWVDWEQNYDHVLSTHSYNPELYRYLSK